MDLQGPNFSDSRNPILNSRDPNWVPETPLKSWLYQHNGTLSYMWGPHLECAFFYSFGSPKRLEIRKLHNLRSTNVNLTLFEAEIPQKHHQLIKTIQMASPTSHTCMCNSQCLNK